MAKGITLTQTFYMTTGGENFFRNKYTTTTALAVAILLFLLPFAEIRCNGFAVAKNTGIGMAIGKDYQIGDDMNSKSPFKSDNEPMETSGLKGSGKVYIAALIALLLGVIGLALSLTNMKTGIVNMVIGILAAVCLIVLMIQVNDDFKGKAGQKANEFTDVAKIKIDFTIWYYLCVVSFLSAAFFSFKRGQLLAMEGAPPNAPQLDIENPGEQSEFPSAASESEVG